MNLSQLLHKLRMVAEIEVVAALLPEVISRADQSSRDTLFERLDRACEPVALRFADEQVDVLGHDDIAKHPQPEAASDALQRLRRLTLLQPRLGMGGGDNSRT